MPATDRDEAVVNEFLQHYLEDRKSGAVRTLEQYRSLFPGHAALIEREYRELAGAGEGAAEHGAQSNGPILDREGGRFGPYALVRLLGRGGQGAVYLAEDTRLERKVALKLLTGVSSVPLQALERFRREAQVASRLDDPGICIVYETGTEHGVPFIAMRYVEGESLAASLEPVRQARLASAAHAGGARKAHHKDSSCLILPPTEGEPGSGAAADLHRVVRLIERVARSLHKAHEAGIVHRDVKPGNILVGRDGLPVLVDFGLAGVAGEVLSSFTRTGDVFGTPAYMSPEQLAGDDKHLDRGTDVYSLGATLYECLTLRHPFEGLAREALYRAIREQDPPSARLFNTAIPDDLWTIVSVALEKDRGRRYRTALDFAEDLRRWRMGEPLRARAASRAYRLRKFAARHRLLVTSALLVVTTLLVATVLSTLGMLRAQRAEVRTEGQRTRAETGELAARHAERQAREQQARAVASERAALRTAYAAQINLAFAAWEQRYWARVLSLLDALRPSEGQEDLRGFEWNCLWSLCHPGLVLSVRNPTAVPFIAAAMSAEGSTFSTLDSGGAVRRYLVSDGSLLEEHELGFGVFAYFATFSRDGSRLAVIDASPPPGREPSLLVLATEGWRELVRLPWTSELVGRMALSRDGRRLAWCAADSRLALLDIDGNRMLAEGPHDLEELEDVEFSPEGELLALAGGAAKRGALRLIDASSGKEVHRADLPALASSLDFDRHGTRLAVGSGWVGRLFEVPSLHELLRLEGHQGGVAAFVSPDDRTLVSWGGNDSTLRFWDVERGRECFPARAMAPSECSPVFSPDGNLLLACGVDSISRLWSVDTPEMPVTIEAPLDQPHSNAPFSLLVFSPDAHTLAMNARDGSLALLDVDSRAIRARIESGSHVTCVAYSSDGENLALGTSDGMVALWHAEHLKPLARIQGHEGLVYEVAFSPDGRTLASCGTDGQVVLRDVSTLAPRAAHAGHGEEAFTILFGPDGALHSAGSNGNVLRWEPEDSEPRSILASHVTFQLVGAPDGRHFASVGNTWVPSLRDLSSGALVTSFLGHAGGSYRAIAFSPDGKTLATGSVDKSVKLWQVSTGKELATLQRGSHVHSLAFAPDGRWLASWSCDGILELWPAASREEIARHEFESPHPPFVPDSPLEADSEHSIDALAAWTIEGDRPGAALGYPVRGAGDVNGDGYGDLLVGAFLANPEQGSEGELLVFHGSSRGPAMAPDWRATGQQPGSQFGQSSASAGDVNGDGYDDVLVGEPEFDGGELNEGRALLFFGSSRGLAAEPAWSVEAEQAEANLGVDVAGAGDVNGDGFDDVLVGAYHFDAGENDVGRVQLFLGSAAGLVATPAWSAFGQQSKAQFGYGIARLGDVDGDGFDDVLVSAYAYDGSRVDEGMVQVFFGSASGLSHSTVWTRVGGQRGAYFGYSVAGAGDVNADGLADLLVGAVYHDDKALDEGKAFLFLGSRGRVLESSTWSCRGDQANAYCGNWVAGAGDVNGDGFDDVLVGASGHGSLHPGEGRVTLHLGSSVGLTQAPAWTGRGEQARAHFGCPDGVGDVNGDGFGDWIVGAHGFSASGSQEGRARLYLGKSGSE